MPVQTRSMIHEGHEGHEEPSMIPQSYRDHALGLSQERGVEWQRDWAGTGACPNDDLWPHFRISTKQ